MPNSPNMVVENKNYQQGLQALPTPTRREKSFAYLEETYSLYDLDPAECVFVDDHPANIEGARAVGLSAILFTSSDDCRRQLDGLLK